MPKKDGGPAFPYSALHQDKETGQLVGTIYADNRGMSLRDWFAGQAMKAMIEKFPLCKDRDQKEVIPDVHLVTQKQGENIRAAIAGVAYQYADAMIVERDK